MTIDSFTYKPIDNEYYALVQSWMSKKHVEEYFHGKGLENTLVDLKKQVMTQTARDVHWIAFHKGAPFGYLIASHVDPKDEDDLRLIKHMKKGETGITLDLLIGEEAYLGRGLAGDMIRCFLLSRYKNVSKIFIDPEVANERAAHVYEKLGFVKLEKFIAWWNPVPHWQMMLETSDLECGSLTEAEEPTLPAPPSRIYEQAF